MAAMAEKAKERSRTDAKIILFIAVVFGVFNCFATTSYHHLQGIYKQLYISGNVVKVYDNGQWLKSGVKHEIDSVKPGFPLMNGRLTLC
jgi:hypothetical protein